MSLASLRREVADCRAWERRLHLGSPGTRATAGLPGWADAVLPLLMPLYGLLALQGSVKFEAEMWVGLFPWWKVLVRGRLFSQSLPSEWEAVHLPSRTGWMLARWSLRLPGLLWLGFCTSIYALLLTLREVPQPTVIRWDLATAYLLLPLLAAALGSWMAAQGAAFHAENFVGLVAGGFLSFLCLVAAVILCQVEEDGTQHYRFSGVGLGIVGIVLIAIMVPQVRDGWRRTPRIRTLRGSLHYARSIIVGGSGIGMCTLLLVGMFVAGDGLLAGKEDSRLHRGLGLVLPALVVILILLVRETLFLFSVADLGRGPHVPTTLPPAKDPSAFPVPTVRSTPGSGLGRTAWVLYRGGLRYLRFPTLTNPVVMLWDLRALPCAAMAIFLLAVGNGRPLHMGFLSWLFAGYCLSVIPSPLALPASRRLHLLGADFPAIARHNLLWGGLTTVLPAAVGGAIIFFVPFPPIHPMAKVGAYLGVIGYLVIRQGADSWSWAREVRGYHGFLLFVVCVALWASSPTAGLFALGTLAFLAAAIGVALDLRDPEAAGRRLAAKAVDD